ncbi:hypothetical protein EDD15DRAFT_2202927 [Pisolithus albus]|nr:hypothetical protein EDD15DRAFT_2202927 [Pisolithus albus]
MFKGVNPFDPVELGFAFLVRARVTVVETSAVPTRLSRERHAFYTFRFTAFSSSVRSHKPKNSYHTSALPPVPHVPTHVSKSSDRPGAEDDDAAGLICPCQKEARTSKRQDMPSGKEDPVKRKLERWWVSLAVVGIERTE